MWGLVLSDTIFLWSCCWELTLLRRSIHHDARASRTYSKTNMACCALWCLRNDIVEQHLERQLTLRQRQMANLNSHEQYFHSVKTYKDVTDFDIEARCFGKVHKQCMQATKHCISLNSINKV